MEGAGGSGYRNVSSSVAGAPGIGDGIFNPRLFERPQAQGTTVAYAAGHVLSLVTRPSVRERRAKLHSAPDDFALLHPDDWRNDFKLCFRLRAGGNHTVEGLVVVRAAVGISGTRLPQRRRQRFCVRPGPPPTRRQLTGSARYEKARSWKESPCGPNWRARQQWQEVSQA